MVEREIEPRLASPISRRRALRRVAVATGAVWTAPVFTSLRVPAFAQGSPMPCELGCVYVARFDDSALTCSACQGVCINDCGTCAGSACARVTSVTRLPDGNYRFCTDCELGVEQMLWVGCREPSPGFCGSSTWQVDPNDPRCGIIPNVGSACIYEIHFTCTAC